MARITVLGGTGYAGAHLVRVAAERGHQVTSISRSRPAEPIEGVDYRTGSVLEEQFLASAVDGADVVVSALSPRGELTGRVRGVLQQLAPLAARSGTRLGVVGGAGSLNLAPDGPKLMDTDAFPADYRPESQEMGAVLDDLRAGQHPGLDWFLVSPAANFGAWAPGQATGTYRLGRDLLLTDADGNSEISGADLADAVVREIESPQHRNQRFTLAY